MRFSSADFCRKVKKEWSAPTLISILLLISLFIMFSLETIGLMNSQNNVSYRLASPETMVKIKNENREVKITQQKTDPDAITVTKISFKLNEVKNNRLAELVHEAAMQQIKYELKLNSESNFINEEDLEFFNM